MRALEAQTTENIEAVRDVVIQHPDKMTPEIAQAILTHDQLMADFENSG